MECYSENKQKIEGGKKYNRKMKRQLIKDINNIPARTQKKILNDLINDMKGKGDNNE